LWNSIIHKSWALDVNLSLSDAHEKVADVDADAKAADDVDDVEAEE